MSSYAGTAGKQRTAANKSIRSEAGPGLNGKSLVKILAIALLVIFTLVSLQAYTATLQHANITLQEENAYIQAEIDSMQSQIVEQTKLTKIEKTATKKYGMVYPTSDNCVTIHEEEEMADNLAATIRSEAYN